MNSIEERDNLIQLMQEALKFYADKINYIPKTKNDLGDRYLTMVELDGGSQAQFAINQAKQLIEQNQKIQDDYDKLILETENFEATGETNPIELINVFIQSRDEDNLTKMRRQGNENPIV